MEPMSLFHKSQTETTELAFTDKEAVIALLYLVSSADGTIDRAEEEMVIAASNRMKLLRKQSNDDFNDAIWKTRTAIDRHGRESVLAAGIKGLPAEFGETVYALAADVVFADGTGQPQEIEFLRKVQEELAIGDELATKVVEVMRLKNRG
jgi:tellurite resistance protein